MGVHAWHFQTARAHFGIFNEESKSTESLEWLEGKQEGGGVGIIDCSGRNTK
jgi:hypothetical protein